MKKTLLFIMVLGLGLSVSAQQSYKFKMDPIQKKNIYEKPTIGTEPIKSQAIVKSDGISKPVTPPSDRNVNIVNIIDIGTSANPWTYASNVIGSQRSLVWADPELNIVTNFHRGGGDLDPGGYSGDLAYDISFDGGQTFTNQIECYIAVDNQGGEYYTDAARYPNHGVYNPTGNVEDAYVAFFCPSLDGTNGIWGGYSFGVANISNTSDSTGNYNRRTSRDGVFQHIPDAYTITSQNLAISFDVNIDWTGSTGIYQGNIILNKGLWDDDEMDIVYEENLVDWEDQVEWAGPWFTSVAFAPDGMTGYLAILGNDGETWGVEGLHSIYPIFWKTVDGGETWDGPHAIQIDGPDGIGGVVDHLLTDEQIEGIYLPPLPARDEIPYTYIGDFEIAVDNNGNLHIAGVVCAAGEAEGGGISFFLENGLGAVLDIFTDDGGTTWYAEEMGRTQRYDGAFGDLNEANRVQISTSPDADKIFISWLDTELEDEEANTRPNIWCRGFDPSTYRKTITGDMQDAPTNVTAFSDAMWEAYFGTAAYTALELTDGVYTIPYVYVEMTPTDDTQPAQYKYIQDFSFSDADFLIQGIGNDAVANENKVSVSQNYPNPFNEASYVTVNLNDGADLSLEVYSITGQMVMKQDYGYTSKGSTTLTINGTDLTPGVYFFTVTAGTTKVTHKMIVE